MLNSFSSLPAKHYLAKRCIKASIDLWRPIAENTLWESFLLHLDHDKPIPKYSLLKAMQLLVSAWNYVSKETVINCCRKANISKKDQMNAVNYVDNPFNPNPKGVNFPPCFFSLNNSETVKTVTLAFCSYSVNFY